MARYPTVEKVVNNYRAYRRDHGGNAATDSANDLAATFVELNGHEVRAERIGNGNRTSTHKGAPLKAYAIHALCTNSSVGMWHALAHEPAPAFHHRCSELSGVFGPARTAAHLFSHDRSR
jgi:hypothetical protein